ncbi:MAG: hypothetical protein NTX40_01295 [Planctomycetota bacterium]|nr:hypothetical protein [Planctomycetota bacterium]
MKWSGVVVMGFVIMVLLSACQKQYRTERMDPARYHADRLLEGDFRVAEDPQIPYHLERLVELGFGDSGPVLLALLNDTSPTPIICVGESIFFRTCLRVDGEPVRKATIADLADWALRQVYKVDKGVGFRGDLPLAEREQAIQRWVKVIEDFERKHQAAEGCREPSMTDGPPGILFPSVP